MRYSFVRWYDFDFCIAGSRWITTMVVTQKARCYTALVNRSVPQLVLFVWFQTVRIWRMNGRRRFQVDAQGQIAVPSAVGRSYCWPRSLHICRSDGILQTSVGHSDHFVCFRNPYRRMELVLFSSLRSTTSRGYDEKTSLCSHW